MAFTYLGLELVTRGVHYDVLRDRTGWGLVYHRNKLKKGAGVRRGAVCINEGIAPYALFSVRTDLPYGTRMFAPEFGSLGSHWIYLGRTTGWVIVSRFMLAMPQGSVGSPIASVSAPAAGYTNFGPAIALPIGFMQPGRRLHCIGDMTATNPTADGFTRLQLGGVDILSAQWNNSSHGQQFELEIWVKDATTITVSTKIVYVVASPPENLVSSAQDFTIANLTTAAMSLQLCIFATAGDSGTYRLIDFPIEVTA